MVFSAAIGTHGGVAEGFKVLLKHLFSIGLALTLGVFAASIPLQFWQRANRWLWFGRAPIDSCAHLGIGHEVKQLRWLSLGVMRFQPSELMKVLVVLFLADHLFARRRSIRFESASSGLPRSLAFSGRFCCWSGPGLHRGDHDDDARSHVFKRHTPEIYHGGHRRGCLCGRGVDFVHLIVYSAFRAFLILGQIPY